MHYSRQIPLQKNSRQIIFNGISYCSLSEAACGCLLESMVPGFKVIEGITFQVPIGQGRSIDFIVNGVLFEFHGLRLRRERRHFGDFRDRHEYRHFRRELARVRRNHYRRDRFLREVKGQLAHNYYDRRRRALDANPTYLGRELIVATSTQEFYERVIKRFSAQLAADVAEFEAIFAQVVRQIGRANRGKERARQIEVAGEDVSINPFINQR